MRGAYRRRTNDHIPCQMYLRVLEKRGGGRKEEEGEKGIDEQEVREGKRGEGGTVVRDMVSLHSWII